MPSECCAEAKARHEVGERWQASRKLATLEGEVRGIRSTINILIAAEKERLDEIEDLKKIVNSRAQGAKL